MKVFTRLRTLPAPGLLTRRESAGGYPTAPGAGWTPAQTGRWHAAMAVAAALPGTPGMGGWTVENEGLYPGARRMLAYWAAAPVTAVAVVHAGVGAGFGMAPTLYAAAAAGTALLVRGAHVTLRAEAHADAATKARAAAEAAGARGRLDQLALVDDLDDRDRVGGVGGVPALRIAGRRASLEDDVEEVLLAAAQPAPPVSAGRRCQSARTARGRRGGRR